MATLEQTRRPFAFAISTIILAMIGWFASFELLTEHIKTLVNPSYSPNCNLSVLVTCGPNMASEQGSIFGFTNTLLGVAAFVAPIVVGMALLAGARFDGWWWLLYQLGLFAGISFVAWLIGQSIFVLGTLCPWCMVVWSVMIPLFWTGLFRPYARGDIPLPEGGRRFFERLYSWNWVFIVLSYVLVAMLAQVQLDWISELLRWMR